VGSVDLDEELCWLAVESRDTRFDGRLFTGVVTTGIYCRPPARAVRLVTDGVVERESVPGRPAEAAALEVLGRGWRPWRSYAVAHLWQSLAGTTAERAEDTVPA